MKIKTTILACAAVVAMAVFSSAQETGNVIPFQGQLANQAGQPLSPSNGVTVIFRLYRIPVGGVAIWEESQPNVSVNAGRFSVLLGSRTLLPSPSYFNSTLYLGITVDDGNPATTDVELRPRQAMVPVISAEYARNADKLNGFDWSSIFGVNSPTGKIAGTKLADASVTGAQIAVTTISSNNIVSGTIGSNQLAAGAVTRAAVASGAIGSQQIANGVVSGLQIATGGIQTSNMADGVVTLPKLAPMQVGNYVGIGGLGLSATADGFETSANSYVDIPGLSVTNITYGRPVLLALMPGDLSTNGACYIGVSGNGAVDAQVNVRFLVNGIAMPPLLSLVSFVERIPVSCFQTICFPDAGTNRFSVQIASGTPGNSLIVYDTRLIAREL